MIERLPIVDEPQWLSAVSPSTIQDATFPLGDILRNSLYYPASGFDGDPVAYLAGNILSFIYVDYSHTREQLDVALANPGFRGYEVIARRDVTERELAPRGWESPFCSWTVLQRLDGFRANHGPSRFSLLYLRADGVAAFQALFVANGVVPKGVAIIQPGHAFGGNWTDFTDPESIFARFVLGNPPGQPELLLYGGAGGRDRYLNPCWPAYTDRVCFLGHTSIGVWRHAQQGAAAYAADRRG
jgi:hypothetical protein